MAFNKQNMKALFLRIDLGEIDKYKDWLFE
jgi:hypothetical protein